MEKSKEDLKKFLLDNYLDERGYLDLSGLDFSDFKGVIDISGMKVGGDLWQNYQIVSGDLIQNKQTVRGCLCQGQQRVGEDLFQSEQHVEGDLLQNYQTVVGGLSQYQQNVRGLFFTHKPKEVEVMVNAGPHSLSIEKEEIK